MKKQIIIFIIFFAVGFLAFKFAADYFNKKSTSQKPSIKGHWILESDHASSLTIKDSMLTYSYEGNTPREYDIFKYQVIENSNGDLGDIIKMYNSLDTLSYEILAKNDTLLNLMDLQYGRINTYILKK